MTTVFLAAAFGCAHPPSTFPGSRLLRPCPVLQYVLYDVVLPLTLCTRNVQPAVIILSGVGPGYVFFVLTNSALMPLGGLGRRGAMVSGGLAFFVGAAFQAAAVEWTFLIIGRILIGIGVSFISAVRMTGSDYTICA